MKKILFLVISGLIISGCSGSSGGTTTDTPPPVIPVVPVQPLVGTFNRLQSEFKIINLSNVEVSRLGVNETVKIRLIAKDEYNNLMTGLNIKFSRILSFSADLIPTEVSPGIYEFNFSSADQLSEEFSVTKDNVSVNLNKDLSVTYCAGASSGGASPFHVIAIQSAEQFYVICNATQLAAARNFTSRNYILGANIDLATYYIDANSDTIPDNQFKIGTDVTPYSGKFKGYNYSIRHFNYSDSSLNNVGLFGKIISGSTISDLTLDSPIIKGANKVGALAGSIETTNASPIIISGINILNATNSSTVGNQQGAFAGLVDGSTGTITISNNSISSTTNLNLSGSSRTQIGGAFGLLKGATVTQNFISSSINYTDKSNTISEIGCGAGRIESVNTFTNNSISCGMILNQGSYIGGISGRAINSYIADGISNTVTQDFTGTNPGDLTFTGGLFGSVATSSLLNLTGYISSNGIKDSFGGVSNFIMGSIATKIVLSGSVTGSSDGIGGLYSILDSTTLDRNISYNSLLVSGNHSVLGGIAALAQNGSSITRSSFNSTLEALNST